MNEVFEGFFVLRKTRQNLNGMFSFLAGKINGQHQKRAKRDETKSQGGSVDASEDKVEKKTQGQNNDRRMRKNQMKVMAAHREVFYHGRMTRWNRFTVILAAIGFVLGEAQAATCRVSFEPQDVKVEWTAFKTTEKVGVGASFKKFKLTGATSGESVAKVLKGLSIEIDSKSVSTGLEMRDQTIAQKFFSVAPSTKILGRVKFAKPRGDRAGQMGLEIEWNGKKKVVPMLYEVTGAGAEQRFEATGTLPFMSLGLKEALRSLNQACFDLHKGPDGVSKTWPVVELKLSSPVRMECL